METSKSNQDSKNLQFVSEEDFKNNLESQDSKVTRTLGVMSAFNLYPPHQPHVAAFQVSS